MMTCGDEIIAIVESVAFGGFGVVRHEGIVVFIPYTVDGDTIRARIVAVKPTYLLAEMVELLNPSPQRQTPPCSYFGICGGCTYQHIRYPHQLAIKEKQLRDLLQRVGKFATLPPLAVIPSPQALHYRLKADFHLACQDGKATLGFMKNKSNEVVAIDSCAILAERINEKLPELRAHINNITVPPRITLWESDEREDDLQVVRLNDKKFMTPASGFFQANGPLLPQFITVVTELCGEIKNLTVVDAYCGSGLFACFLATAKEVIGIEQNAKALACARKNFSREESHNGSFWAGDCSRIFYERVLRKGKSPAVIIVDPPRSGCAKSFLMQLASLPSAKIVYVSCNPSTLARDLRVLVSAGFSLKKAYLLDMFPQCSHIESVTYLEK
ncbi:MAG: class I SAM-dependent RNA methyltransferase [Deltaproteobacteria bacterium]|nr:class I SAM-dependent RNA methyltransferase [Deltaproteobacteria bacterium]